jgi:alpha-L-arabinofuranosidase
MSVKNKKHSNESGYDFVVKNFNTSKFIFTRATPETSKKCNHVEVGYPENNIMLFELVKYHDHIEIDNGSEIIKDDYQNWNNWIDMFENELIQKKGCLFTSMFLKDETELKKLFESKV